MQVFMIINQSLNIFTINNVDLWYSCVNFKKPFISCIRMKLHWRFQFHYFFFKTAFSVVRLSTFPCSLSIAELKNFMNVFSWASSISFGNIPAKLLKEVSDICAPVLNDIWNNEIITQRGFPDNLKLADVTCVQKRGCFLVKEV